MFTECLSSTKGFACGSVVKNLPAKQEMQIRSWGQEDSLEKEMAIHSNILTWKIPWMEEPINPVPAIYGTYNLVRKEAFFEQILCR